MGPSRLFQKDRSQHSLLNAQEANEKRSPYHASPNQSPLHSPSIPPSSGQHPQYDDEDEDLDEDDHSYGLPYRQEEAQQRYQQVNHPHGPGYQPTRSQSQRGPPTSINTNQPTIHLVRPPHATSSTPASAIEPDEPDKYYYQRPEPNPPPHKEDRRQKRRFFGLGSSKEQPTSSNKLGRSRSIRGKEQYPEPPPEIVRQQQQQQHQQALSQAQAQAQAQAHHQSQLHQWESAHVSPTDDEEEEEEGGAGLHPSIQSSLPGLPDKDPLRSPAFPPPITHQEYTHGKSLQQSNNQRNTLERSTSYQSSWDRTAHHIQQQGQQETGQQQIYQPSPSSITSNSGYSLQNRPQHESLQQHWQDPDSRPSSRQSLEPPVSNTSHPYGHHARANSSQASSSTSYMQGSMGPPQPPSRRSSEAQQSQQAGTGRDQLTYQPYSQTPVLGSNAPPAYSAQLAAQNQIPRGGPQPSPMQIGEQGRSTPPPSRSRDDLSGLDVPSLLQRHDELQDKYRKVKKYYFDKDAHVQQLTSQVQQLQNALAHQRLSLSRTSLDDNEYANRFSRLDGAINNLAFNLRREWRSIPPWLAPYVNRDANMQPTKEMTAVGRAAISRWLVEEVLDRYFHPAIEPGFSSQLKLVEKNLRRHSPPGSTEEEKDSLLSKIASWRLSTLDGLQDALHSPQAGEYRALLTTSLTEKLTASLQMLLKDPPPPGLEGGVSMIIELAVGIAANLPLESRDVFVEYILPGQIIDETYMNVEKGLPLLTNPGEGPTDPGDAGSLGRKQTEDTGSIDSRETGNSNGNGSDETPASSNPSSGQTMQISPSVVSSAQQQQQAAAQQKEAQSQQNAAAKKKSMFGSLMGGGGSTAGSTGAGAGGKRGPQGSGQQQQGQQQGGPGQPLSQQQAMQEEKKEDRVRFSTFMAVEVRGRNVLIKAPVYLRD